MKSIVITGVSSGIGFATARECALNGVRVFGSVRNEADAKRVKQELGDLFTPLIFDITDAKGINQAAAFVREQLAGEKLWGLVNNAGIAVTGALLEVSADDIHRQLDVNVFGQILVSQAFIPLLGEDKTLSGVPGKIINIGSEAGKQCNPFLGLYSISKHAMEAFTNTLRIELLLYGIDVVLIGPGPIDTQIWQKGVQEVSDEKIQNSRYAKAMEIYKKYILKVVLKNTYPPERIAKLIYTILNNPHPKVRYAPVPKKFINWTIPNLMPTRWRDKLIGRALGFLNKNKQ